MLLLNACENNKPRRLVTNLNLRENFCQLFPAKFRLLLQLCDVQLLLFDERPQIPHRRFGRNVVRRVVAVEVAVVVDLHKPYNVNIQMLENYAQHYRTIKMQKISDAFSDAVTNQCTAEVGE